MVLFACHCVACVLKITHTALIYLYLAFRLSPPKSVAMVSTAELCVWLSWYNIEEVGGLINWLPWLLVYPCQLGANCLWLSEGYLFTSLITSALPYGADLMGVCIVCLYCVLLE